MLPISMNLKSKRNNMIKSLTLSIGLALTLATPAFGAIEWGFDTAVNPAVGVGGPGSAATVVGPFGTGWHNGGAIPWNLGSAQGFWDLGKSGSIMLSGMGLTSPVSLQVFQWVDAPFYTGGLTYQVNNGTVLPLTFSQITENTAQGSWQRWNAAFSLDPTDIVKITAPNGGAIIDRMVLTVVPEPATMIAGALLLLPFALSTLRVLRRNRAA